jgi:hypothetical protein
MLVRDSIKRGESFELEVIKFLKDKCGIDCRKNDNKYDIDIVAEIDGKEALIEVEESSDRYWPSHSNRPTIPSKLLTIPIRKIKYFVNEGYTLEEYLKKYGTIRSIEEFESIFDGVDKFTPKDDKLRIWLKLSHNFGEYLCIVTQNVICDALNHNLKDQSDVDKRILELKEISSNSRYLRWYFKNNLWENRNVKSMNGKPRDDPVLLILGRVDKENDLIFCHKRELCYKLKQLVNNWLQLY